MNREVSTLARRIEAAFRLSVSKSALSRNQHRAGRVHDHFL